MSGVEIVIQNIKELQAGLEAKEAQLIKAVNATTNDFRSRGPGWISQEVSKVYTIKKKDVTQSRKEARVSGKIKIAGVTLNNVKIEYRGSLLTPVHFKMSPKKRPNKNGYRIAVEIKKGSKTRLPRNVFLADNKGGTQIPFQREGSGRYPIRSVKSVSVPQMITNKDTSDAIRNRINKELIKRLEHNVQRYNK